jgi:zinc/manganese transport system permease protein
MFSGVMVDSWLAATTVAAVAGVVGFFIVLRGSAFVAHALPNGAFAGAAAATLLGLSTILGLVVFAVAGALGIGTLGRRGRHDAVTALALIVMLGSGSLFLSLSSEYAPEVYSLLFGEVLGVSPAQLAPTAVIAAVCIAAVLVLYRPLILSSVIPEVAAARGVRTYPLELAFLVIVALATSMTVPVVGALLIFSLLIGPPAAARAFTDRPLRAIALSVAIALTTVWVAVAASYLSNLPIGFFVGALSALSYTTGRIWTATRVHRTPLNLLTPSTGSPS